MSEARMVAVIAEVTDENKDALVQLALAAYLGERCKYCTKVYETLDELKTAVWAGVHEHGRLACEECWRKNNDN